MLADVRCYLSLYVCTCRPPDVQVKNIGLFFLWLFISSPWLHTVRYCTFYVRAHHSRSSAATQFNSKSDSYKSLWADAMNWSHIPQAMLPYSGRVVIFHPSANSLPKARPRSPFVSPFSPVSSGCEHQTTCGHAGAAAVPGPHAGQPDNLLPTGPGLGLPGFWPQHSLDLQHAQQRYFTSWENSLAYVWAVKTVFPPYFLGNQGKIYFFQGLSYFLVPPGMQIFTPQANFLPLFCPFLRYLLTYLEYLRYSPILAL
jgi:hypothetical protein